MICALHWKRAEVGKNICWHNPTLRGNAGCSEGHTKQAACASLMVSHFRSVRSRAFTLNANRPGPPLVYGTADPGLSFPLRLRFVHVRPLEKLNLLNTKRLEIQQNESVVLNWCVRSQRTQFFSMAGVIRVSSSWFTFWKVNNYIPWTSPNCLPASIFQHGHIGLRGVIKLWSALR